MEKLRCYCRKEEYGELMIYCDNNDCCIQWFHTTCLQITTIPKVKWYCPDCQRKPIKESLNDKQNVEQCSFLVLKSCKEVDSALKRHLILIVHLG